MKIESRKDEVSNKMAILPNTCYRKALLSVKSYLKMRSLLKKYKITYDDNLQLHEFMKMFRDNDVMCNILIHQHICKKNCYRRILKLKSKATNSQK